MKKILSFAPYGSWLVHHQLDAVVGAALARRGCSVQALCCDGVFNNCLLVSLMDSSGKALEDSKSAGDDYLRYKTRTNKVLAVATGKKRPQNISEVSLQDNHCLGCFSKAVNLFSALKIPILKFSSFLSKDDVESAFEWSRQIMQRDFKKEKYNDWPIWDWVFMTIYGQTKSSYVDLSNSNVYRRCQSIFYNGVLTCLGFSKALELVNPDHVICYSGAHPYYRIAYELSRIAGKDVLVHERGQIDDSFFMLHNNVVNLGCSMTTEWNLWKNVPLNTAKLNRVRTLAYEREQGRNNNFFSFANWSSKAETVCRLLRIPAKSTKLILFTSGDWEYSISMALGQKSLFKSQYEWVKYTADICEQLGWQLIVRHHPLGAGTKTYPRASQFITKSLEFNLSLGDHVRVIMPAESVSSYDLMWNADAVTASFSTTAWEAAIRGVIPIYTAYTINVEFGIEQALEVEDYVEKLKKACRITKKGSLEYLRLIYKLVNFLYYIMMSQRFKHFGIKDIYNHDIRFHNFCELDEGNDETLDRVCDHIIKGGSLFSLPDGGDYSDEEDQFLAKELKNIREYRARIRTNAVEHESSYKEPLVNVLAVVGNENVVLCKSKLGQSLKRSRHKNFNLTECICTSQLRPAELIDCILKSLYQLEAEYVYISAYNTYVDESVISSSIDMLDQCKNDLYQGAAWGVYWCPGSEIVDELFTKIHPNPGLPEVLKRVPPLRNPVLLLSLIVWKRYALVELLNNLKQSGSRTSMELTIRLYENIFSDDSRFCKMDSPSVVIHDAH